MLVGINYPWLDYGWDFGDPPQEWVAAESLPARHETKRKRIEEDFRLFASKGIFAVRWFLLADGLNYGMGEFAPRESGKSWTFEPLPDGHPYYSRLCEDFEFVLRACRQNDLKLFPSLMDFHWCRQGMPVAGSPGVVKGGRSDILRDPAKRLAFFDRTLDPLLESSMQYADSVYGWELINEPEWVVHKFSILGKKNPNRTVSQKEMKEFIAEGMRRINTKHQPDGGRSFQSSVGFAHWESLNKWNVENLGITLRQFHYYAQQNRELPENLSSTSRPCIVGEFATAAGKDWPDLKNLNMEQTVTNRLRRIEDKGYPACFLWSAKAIDPATRWSEEVHREVMAYNTTNRPDSLRG